MNENGKFRCIDECPKCGRHTRARAVDSRMDETLSLRVRRKECLVCKTRWDTVEVTLADFDVIRERSLETQLKALDEAKKEIADSIKSLCVASNNVNKSIEAIDKLTIKTKNILKGGYLHGKSY